MYKDILLAVDIADPSDQMKAVTTAVEYAGQFGSRLHVISVVPDYGLSIVGGYFPAGHEEKAIEEARTKLQAFTGEHVPSGVEVQHIIGHGTIYSEILRAAEAAGADLIVMATHRPELADYLLGPNTERVVRHANCSVLAVRS